MLIKYISLFRLYDKFFKTKYLTFFGPHLVLKVAILKKCNAKM